MNNCIHCNKPLTKRNNIYCTNQCQADHTISKVINNYLINPIPETYYDNGQQVRKTIRRYFIKQFDNKCFLCGWDKKHPNSDLPPLELHHIDDNWKNCNPNNITVLCPNCHSLTDSYKSRNKGSGREYRRSSITCN